MREWLEEGGWIGKGGWIGEMVEWVEMGNGWRYGWINSRLKYLTITCHVS